MRRAIILLMVSSGVLAGCGQADWNGTSTSEETSPATALSTLAPDRFRDVMVQLKWQANPDPIAGYMVYYGPSGDQATVQVSDLSAASAGFDPKAPSVAYSVRRDLGLQPGNNVCFRLRAYNSQQTLSPWSAAACTTI